MTDSTGAIRARYDYDPYGRIAKVSGDLDSDFGFTGFYRHQTSGLNLTMYRAYDADLGRFTSRDPIEEEGGLNLYRYVGNNPINDIDPLGLAPGDKRYGLPDDFWHWYHRKQKRNGDSDIPTKKDADDKYEEWKEAGCPSGSEIGGQSLWYVVDVA